MISGMLAEKGYPGEVQNYTETGGGYSGKVRTWAKKADIVCIVNNLNGNEIVQYSKIGITATHKIYMEKIDINEQDRILVNGKYYDIKYVDNPMLFDEFLEVICASSDNYEV